MFTIDELLDIDRYPLHDPSSTLYLDAVDAARAGLRSVGCAVIKDLVLESLIMVIRYNQQALAGFLYYPVAIISSASFLLIALSVFIKLSIPLQDDSTAQGGAREPMSEG